MIDYEAEYNNRARWPDHPAIIAGWARDAAAFRETNPPQVIPYGPGERQKIDLFRAEPDRSTPLVLFIHGGYWQALDRSFFSHLASGVNAHGIAFAVAGYDLCPAVTVGAIVDQMRAAAIELSRFGDRLTAVGHSAGGHLAACPLATNWRAVDPRHRRDLVGAAYAISGLFDLGPLVGTSINGALGLDAAEAERQSPLFFEPPTGLSIDAVVGSEESGEYHRQSRTLVERWTKSGVAARYEAVPDATHFTVIAPLADPASAMTKRVAELARTVSS